jgi:hypothetical protein
MKPKSQKRREKIFRNHRKKSQNMSEEVLVTGKDMEKGLVIHHTHLHHHEIIEANRDIQQIRDTTLAIMAQEDLVKDPKKAATSESEAGRKVRHEGRQAADLISRVEGRRHAKDHQDLRRENLHRAINQNHHETRQQNANVCWPSGGRTFAKLQNKSQRSFKRCQMMSSRCRGFAQVQPTFITSELKTQLLSQHRDLMLCARCLTRNF